MTLRLRPFQPEDDRELIAWFPDAAALRTFAGDTLTWPLEAAGRGDRAIELNVYPSNAPAIRLYRSMGFEDQPASRAVRTFCAWL